MKKLQVIGMGCAKCVNLASATEEAAKALGLEFQIEKVTNLEQMIGLGVTVTPALAVDGKVKVAGYVPSVDDLKKLLA